MFWIGSRLWEVVTHGGSTVLNIFENKKGIIKILVYSPVIDINQNTVIFFVIINCNELLGAICIGCFMQ